MTDFGWWTALAYAHLHIVCCLCFEEVRIDQAFLDADGVRWDMCPACGWAEERIKRERAGQAGITN